MIDSSVVMKGLDIYEEHVRNYDLMFRQKNKLPKNYDFRPYRWCSRDIVFSLMVVRHNRHGNFLEVDVCLIANPPQYFENSGARVALGFILSEAYKCGGSMEIVFSKNVENGRVPAYICDLAIDLGVKLKHVFEGHITPFEARQLYLGLVGFSTAAKDRIMKLAVDGKISPERACFVVIGGVWSLPEAESVILGSANPERILASLSDPADRHLYLADLVVARTAIFGGSLDRKILRTELMENGEIVESEDEEFLVGIDFDPVYFAKIYRIESDLMVPWLQAKNLVLKQGQQMVVLVRSRTDTEIKRFFPKDLKALEGLIAKYEKDKAVSSIFYLTTRDFEDLAEEVKIEMMKVLDKRGVYLMISPESVAGLTKETIRRLETGKVIRQ